MSKVNARSHSPGFGVIMRQVRCRAHMSVPRCPEIQEAKDKFPAFEELFIDWKGLKREPRVKLDKMVK